MTLTDVINRGSLDAALVLLTDATEPELRKLIDDCNEYYVAELRRIDALDENLTPEIRNDVDAMELVSLAREEAKRTALSVMAEISSAAQFWLQKKGE